MNTAWTAASEEMYKAQQAGGAQPQGEAQQPNDNGNVMQVHNRKVKM